MEPNREQNVAPTTVGVGVGTDGQAPEHRPERRNLRNVYEKMSQEDKQAFWEDLGSVFLWRGWNRVGNLLGRLDEHVENMVKLYARNGLDLDEYT